MKKKCKVEGCNNKVIEKGYCNNHYMQVWNHGKVLERTKYTPNEIRIVGDICYMDLYNTKNEVKATTKFNKEHLDKVKKYKWCYVFNEYTSSRYNKKKVYLHRIIKKGKEIDHIDCDKLNNLNNNLRVVTRRQNSINKYSKNYYYNKKRNKYGVVLSCNGDTKKFGYFKTEEEAKKVAQKERKKRYQKMFGETNTFIK